jgi:Flp pilus assembly protein CpaB
MASIAQPRPAAPRPAAPANVRNPQFRTPLFVVGVGLALFAFLAMFTFGLIFASKSGSGAQITVVVPRDPISARDRITPDELTTVRVQSTSALRDAFSSPSALSGYYAVVDIPTGQAITPNMVSPDIGSVPIAVPHIIIPTGYVIVTLPTSEQQGVAGYINQGDYIDIMVTLDKSAILKGTSGSVTRTVFTSVYVVRVGPQTSLPRTAQAPGVTSSITLLMSQCDAQFMYWFTVNATVKYTLLSAKDYPKEQPAADSNCPPTSLPPLVGPRTVDTRWSFSKG